MWRCDGDGAVCHTLSVDHGVIRPGVNTQGTHVICRHALEPYGLPDARYGGVPHTAPFLALLAVGKDLIGQMICDRHHQRVGTLQTIRNIKREGRIAAMMFAQQDSV